MLYDWHVETAYYQSISSMKLKPNETTNNWIRFEVYAQRGLVFIFPVRKLKGPTYLLEKTSLVLSPVAGSNVSDPLWGPI